MLVPKQIEYLDQQYSTDSNPSVEKMRVMSEECGATFEQVHLSNKGSRILQSRFVLNCKQ
jgi:hypothetical protein